MDSDGLDDDLKQDSVNLIMPDHCRRKLENEAPRSKLRGITELNSEDFSEGEANPVASYGECQVQDGRCLRDTNVSDSSSGSLPDGTGSGASNPLGICRLKHPRLYAARIDYHVA